MKVAAVAAIVACAVPVSAQRAPPPTLAAQPVTDDYHGQKIGDRFRFVEKTEPANAKEFGSVRDVQGFRNLLAMDSYQAIRDGVRLPPFLVTTGLQDPRVVPWQPAKFVARLQEAGDTAFLRLDAQRARCRHGRSDGVRFVEVGRARVAAETIEKRCA